MESEEEYANPRNLASGSLTLKDINEVKERHLRWIPFTLVYVEEEIISWGERMAWLEHQGFKPVDRECIEQPNEMNIQSVIKKTFGQNVLFTGEQASQSSDSSHKIVRIPLPC